MIGSCPAGDTRPGRLLVAIAAIGLLTAVATAGCGGGSGAPGNGARHVSAVVLPYLTFVPFHIAAEEGYFEDQGLDVEFIRLGRNQDVMTALAQGDVDVSAGMVTVNELNLVAGGARIRVVAAMGQLTEGHCAFAALVARREHVESGALEDPERLRELRVDADLLIPIGYWLGEYLRPLGLTVDDLDPVNLPSPAAVEALRNGSIDVTLDSEPFLSMYAAMDEATIHQPMNEIVPGYVISVIMYGADLLDDRPDVGERFATAMLAAMRQYARGKTPRNLEIARKATGLTREQVAGACWADMRTDGRVDPSTLRDYQEWAVRRGLVDRVLSEEELYDHRFIDHANAELAR